MQPLTNITTIAAAALTDQATKLSAEIASDQAQLADIATEQKRRAALPPPKPIVTPAPGSTISVATNTQYVLKAGASYTFAGVKAINDWNIVGNGATINQLSIASATGWSVNNVRVAAAVVNGAPQGSFGHVTASKGTLDGIVMGPLSQGITLDGKSELTINNLSTETNNCVWGQCVMVLDGKITGNNWKLLGSKNESPIRSTSGGPGSAGLYDSVLTNVWVSQPAGNGKACITLRFGNNITLNNPTCVNANLSLRTGGAEPGSTPTTITNVTISNAGISGNAKLEIGDGASNVTVNNLVVTAPNNECLSVSQTGTMAPIVGIKINNSTGHSGHGFYKAYGPVPAGAVTITNSTLFSPDGRTPFAKNDVGTVLSMGPTNLVKAGS